MALHGTLSHVWRTCVLRFLCRVEAVAFNSFRDLVASCGADGRVALISVDTGKQVRLGRGARGRVGQVGGPKEGPGT